jgi:hypothetical protein
MRGGGSVFDRVVIVILQSAFYHTGIFKSRNFCKPSGMRRLGEEDRHSNSSAMRGRLTFRARIMLFFFVVGLCQCAGRARDWQDCFLL